MIEITSQAADRINKLERDDGDYLRIAIKGGGCSGFQYDFSLTPRNDEDIDLKSLIIIDPISYEYLDGSEIDYKSSLEGELFTISNPNAKSTCGCGESFGI